MKTFFIEPLDSLFFRDGHPFEVGGDANLQIPPSPSTFYGALRSAIISSIPNGLERFISGERIKLSKWVGEYGDGEGETAKLAIQGPIFARLSEGKIEQFFPLPRDLLNFSVTDKSSDTYKNFLVSTKLREIPNELLTDNDQRQMLLNPYAQTAKYNFLLIHDSQL